ncbi:ferredoxin family protein [Methanobrevibacter sp. TMH8]|uniref:4Fe-4S dicluster domain-containing protein n=1 Tax=Methanobrevibacter sp. TMH8 TaxID=2848611 RepID=UPI001CCBA97E|nr:ferredoxin family protein [Methanobrevibacter sp. TMH8]MBZ9571176.1 ferredoxin family protein [Methanobrevibacter sp. TMH8]
MIKIDSELCKGCDICIASCPKHVYVKSSKENKKGVYLPCPENEEECTKCHLCELLCPDQAITVEDNNDNNENGEMEEQND